MRRRPPVLVTGLAAAVVAVSVAASSPQISKCPATTDQAKSRCSP